MEYDAQGIPFSKTVLSSTGFTLPLCNNCISTDCTNPIKEKSVSIFGKNITMRLWVSGNIVKQITSCRGFVPPEGEQD